MARPQKVIQRRANGQYFVRLQVPNEKDPKKPLRLTRSLETKDAVVAAQRAAQAIQELRQQARLQERGMTKCRDPEVFSQLVASVGGDVDVDDVIRQAGLPVKQDETRPIDGPGGERYLDPEAEALADALLAGRLPLTWHDLIREAAAFHKRKTKKDYSGSWFFQAEQSAAICPFSPEEASVTRIRDWIKELEKDGEVDKKVGALQSLFTTCIRTGLLDVEVNPFKQISFGRSAHSAVHIPTAEEENYRLIAEKKLRDPNLPKPIRIALLLCLYTGVRYSEIRKRTAEDFDLKEELMFVHDSKNPTSSRLVPLPSWVCDEIKEWGFSEPWVCLNTFNKHAREASTEHVKVTSHSWRHGLTAIGRGIRNLDKDALEVFLGHSLPGMKQVYGTRKGRQFTLIERYPVDVVRDNLELVWANVDELLGIN